MERPPAAAGPPLVVLALLGTVAALYFLQAILVPIALALLLACIFSPVVTWLRRLLPLSAIGASLLLFILLAVGGLYLASLVAESMVQAANSLPGELVRLSDRLGGLEEKLQEQPMLKRLLPEPGTIGRLLYESRLDLIGRFRDGLIDRLTELTVIVARGFIILVLVLFLLAESDMLTPKVIRALAAGPGDAKAAERTFRALTREIRSYLLARTVINLGMGLAVALILWLLGVPYPLGLGGFAAVTNYVPYVGQVAGGAVPVLVAMFRAQSFGGAMGDGLIVASAYLAVVTVAEYVVVPYVLGRSLDLNGTTVLIACLFWGFLWGLVGLVLAIPLTVSAKLVCQHFPSLHRWAELMSLDWQPPAIRADPPEPAAAHESAPAA